MSNEVVITARAELDDVVKALRQIQDKGGEAQKELAAVGKDVTQKLRDNSKQTQRFLEDLKDFARRAAEEIRGSFEGIVKAGAIKLGDALVTQMKGAVSGAMQLNDTLRKVGNTLGITGAEFAKFQTDMTEGLGRLGFDAETASRALQGLSETQVRGKDAMLDYARVAALLAGTSGERGKEGDIVKGIAGVIGERGGDVNDRGQMMQVVNAALGTFLATGKSVTSTLDDMRGFFKNMASDRKAAFDPKTFKGMALAEAVSPGAMAFFKAYNDASALGRLPASAQGMGKSFNANGLDVDFLRKFLKGAMGRIGFSPEDAMKTFGINEDAARGAVMLAKNLDKLEQAQGRAAKQTKTLGEAYEDSLTMGEALQGGANRLKAKAAGPLASGTTAATDIAKRLAKGDTSVLKEHAGLVAGAGFLGLAGGASILGSIFSKKGGVGSQIGGALTMGAAAEAVTGQKTIPVFVVNMPSGGILGGMPGGIGGAPGAAGGGLGKAMGAAGFILGAAGVAIMASSVAIDAIEANTKDASGKSWGTRSAAKIDEFVSGATFGKVQLADAIHSLIEALTGNKSATDINTEELKKSAGPSFRQTKGPKDLTPTTVGSRGTGQ